MLDAEGLERRGENLAHAAQDGSGIDGGEVGPVEGGLALQEEGGNEGKQGAGDGDPDGQFAHAGTGTSREPVGHRG